MSNQDFTENPKDEDSSRVKESADCKFITETTFENFSADSYSIANTHNRSFNYQKRKEFCRSVYFLLCIQVVVAASIAYINFLVNKFYPPFLSYFLMALEVFLIAAINISSCFCFKCRLYFPMNFIMLLIYTFLEGCLLGSLAFVIQDKVVSCK